MIKKQIVLFCGGSGASELVRVLSQLDELELTVLVNCYDDGLSTGQLRECVRGMLGPSDVRKNVRHSLGRERRHYAEFERLLQFRFPESRSPGALTLPDLPSSANAVLRGAASAALGDHRRGTLLRDAVERFLDHLETNDTRLALGDVSLANVFFAGLYLEHANFNRAVRSFSEFFELKNRIFNLTDGADRKLVGLTDDPIVIPKESRICALEPSQRLQDIFLLQSYLAADELRLLEQLGLEEKRRYLSACSRTPQLNPEARDAILAADVILYWPGTQHSSLFPSYLTEGVAEAVSQSRANRKVLVTNILKDHDIHNETAFSLVEKFFWFISRKATRAYDSAALVTDIVMNDPGSDADRRFLPLGSTTPSAPRAALRVDRWSNADDRHNISKLLGWLNQDRLREAASRPLAGAEGSG